ncbi:MAG: hypothetical protein DRO12_04335 [Thermoprotei archaeon]|nr:MAG: hypothetical protein DRO12_04335 [Thermoprotei archaeon]
MKLSCNVAEVQRSLVPNVSILTIDCSGGVSVKMDIHDEVNTVDKGDRILFTISKEVPKFEEGRDFVASGYVIKFKEEGDRRKMIVSLWGFVVIIESRNPDVFKEFRPMDKVYVKIAKL